MARGGSAIVAAQIRVVQSRHDLRNAMHGLRSSLSRPSSLIAAFAVGAVLGRLPAGMLVSLLLRAGARRVYESSSCTVRGRSS